MKLGVCWLCLAVFMLMRGSSSEEGTVRFPTVGAGAAVAVGTGGDGEIRQELAAERLALEKVRLDSQGVRVAGTAVGAPDTDGDGSVRPELAAERLALEKVRHDWRGIRGWVAGRHVCSWTGVSCHPGTNAVRAISLAGQGLVGPLNAAIWELRSLESLDLRGNRLSGALPPFKGDPYDSALRSVVLSNNRFEGEIPAFVGQLRWLRTLDLGSNAFSGKVPSIGALRMLERLDLGGKDMRLNQLPDDFCEHDTVGFDRVKRECNVTGSLFDCLKVPRQMCRCAGFDCEGDGHPNASPEARFVGVRSAVTYEPNKRWCAQEWRKQTQNPHAHIKVLMENLRNLCKFGSQPESFPPMHSMHEPAAEAAVGEL